MRYPVASIALVISVSATAASGQIARPAAAYRSLVPQVLTERADSTTHIPTLMHDIRVGATIGGVGGLALTAVVASIVHANRADFIVCAPQPQGFACPAQRKGPATLAYLAIGAAGGAMLGSAMGAGYHQNRSP